jgi:hypothetical protein
MASLAPFSSEISSGVFIAGLEVENGCKSIIQVYSNKNNSWDFVDI